MNQFFNNIKPGGQLLALVLIFVVLFIIAVGAMIIMILVEGNPVSLGSQAVSQIVAFAGTALVFAWMFQESPLEYLKITGGHRVGKGMLGATLVLLCVIPLSDWLTTVNESWHFPQSMAWLEEQLRQNTEKSQALVESFLLRDVVGAFLSNLLVLAVLPAICEELLFRGALQQTLGRCLRNPHVVIWLTAAIFSLFHGEVFAFLPRFMLGAALGYLFYYGGSLWINATAHFLNNAILVVLYYLANLGVIEIDMTESFNTPWYLALAGLVVAILFFRLFFCKKNDNISLDENS